MKKTFIMIRSVFVLTSAIIYTIRAFEIMHDEFNLRLLMSYTYGAPILDVSRSHTTTQHSR
jgi:hypothetical protein